MFKQWKPVDSKTGFRWETIGGPRISRGNTSTAPGFHVETKGDPRISRGNRKLLWIIFFKIKFHFLRAKWGWWGDNLWVGGEGTTCHAPGRGGWTTSHVPGGETHGNIRGSPDFTWKHEYTTRISRGNTRGSPNFTWKQKISQDNFFPKLVKNLQNDA